MRTKIKDIISELAEMIPENRVKRAKAEADKEIFYIRLSHLREIYSDNNNGINLLSNYNLSKIESNKDLKISTLIDYFEGIGMGLEIKVFPKNHPTDLNEITLLKV